MLKNFKNTMCNECKIYLDKCCISDIPLIKDYIEFLADDSENLEENLKFTLHCGSECFDAACLVVSLLKCLAYNDLDNDEILSNLQEGDQVFYKSSAGTWRGTQWINGDLYGVIECKGYTSKFKYEENKYRLLRNNGGRTATVGKRVKVRKEKSKEFLSEFYNISIANVPNESKVSLIVLANAEYLKNIYSRIDVSYGKNGELVPLSILAPGAYYTDSGQPYGFTHNGSEIEPVVKGVSKVINARDKLFDYYNMESKPVGVVVLDLEKYIEDTEIEDVLTNSNLRFVNCAGKLTARYISDVIYKYETPIFACTKELLKKYPSIDGDSEVAKTLGNQCNSILSRELCLDVKNVFDSKEYYACLKKLNQIRESSWDENEKLIFLRTAYSIIKYIFNLPINYDRYQKHLKYINLYNEKATIEEKINNLSEHICSNGIVKQNCNFVIEYLKTIAMVASEDKLYDIHKSIDYYLVSNPKAKGLVVVDKKEMVLVLDSYLKDFGKRIKVVDKSHYPFDEFFDVVFVIGNIQTEKFNPLECYNTKIIHISIHSSVYYKFKGLKKRTNDLLCELNNKMSLKNNESSDFKVLNKGDSTVDEKEDAVLEETEDYLDRLNSLEFNSHIYSKSSYNSNIKPATVIASGTFESGEYILFSQFYKALVYDRNTGKVIEKKVSDLTEGDILIFGKNDDYTKNLVDALLEQAIKEGRVPNEQLRLSLYWKKTLAYYMSKEKYTYKGISNLSNLYGKAINFTTISSWLRAENHIVGPRNRETFVQLAAMLKDDYFKNNVDAIFEACRFIRKVRRTLLSAISKTMVRSVCGITDFTDSLEKYAADYMDKNDLYRSMVLTNIFMFAEEKYANQTLTNRPLEDMEV